jgi:MFS family permease
MSSSTAMANWFERLRGRALGIANMGGPAGPIVIAPVAAWAIGQIGWRGTLLGFAALTLAIGVPCVWFGMIDRPSDVGQFPDGELPAASESDGGEVLGHTLEWSASLLARCRDFWFAALAAGPFAAVGIVMATNAIPYMTVLGATPEAAALVVIPQSIGAVLGPVVFGALADRIHPRLLFVGLIGLLCTGLVGLVLQPSYAVALVLFSMIGIVGGSMMAVYGALVARLFGAQAFGQVLGMGALVGLPAIVLTPLAFGAAFDATGSYSIGLLIMVGTLAAAALLFALLPSGQARRPA